MYLRSAVVFFSLLLALFSLSVSAAVRLPAIIGDHMVLQRDQPVRVWGWDTPGTRVVVELGDDRGTGVAGAENGRWEVELKALPASAEGMKMTVRGSSVVEVNDILVGEVWVGSGQSNMQWRVKDSLAGELAIASAQSPQVRLITVPVRGTQELQDDFNGSWVEATPETVAVFSAVAYYYGDMLHRALGVPVGLIHCSWGGSTAEAWVSREVLESEAPFYSEELQRWENIEASYDYDQIQAEHKEKMAQWEKKAEEARASGAKVPNPPRLAANVLVGQHRPGNLYAGMLHPILGYGIRGVIWYQGENNGSRPREYQDLFPLVIQNWRDAWNQGDFPFYWVQLADFRATKPEPEESDWAVLREAQTMTLDRLPKTGQAVIIDLGEANDIHPRNKRDVADRLARWALANDYGIDVHYRSPQFRAMERKGERMVLQFDYVGTGLRTRDVSQVKGFAIAGADGAFVWAEAAIQGKDTIEVWSPTVSEPVAVRYAWADNPDCNIFSREGLPLTPFRTQE